MHAIIITMIEDTLRLLFSMLRIEEDILLTSAALMVIEILEPLPLRLGDILVELFLSLFTKVLLICATFCGFLGLFLEFWDWGWQVGRLVLCYYGCFYVWVRLFLLADEVVQLRAVCGGHSLAFAGIRIGRLVHHTLRLHLYIILSFQRAQDLVIRTDRTIRAFAVKNTSPSLAGVIRRQSIRGTNLLATHLAHILNSRLSPYTGSRSFHRDLKFFTLALIGNPQLILQMFNSSDILLLLILEIFQFPSIVILNLFHPLDQLPL